MSRSSIPLLLLCGALALPAAPPLPIFDSHGDLGVILRPGSADYDPARHSYLVSGSGENMWFAADALHFVWKKVSGNVALSAEVSILGQGGNAHRKAVLMIRQSLDPDSAYADVALHGDGLTSLQFRDEKGAPTREVRSILAAPARLRIEKRGDDIFPWVGAAGEELRPSGGSIRLRLDEPFYIGIGVCSHDKDAVEKAEFSNVELTTPAALSQPVVYSTLETVPVSSGDRRSSYVTTGRIEAVRWSNDGAALLFTRQGRLFRIPASGGTPLAVEAGTPSVNDSVSPDGLRRATLSGDEQKTLSITTVSDGKVTFTAKGSLDTPSWSPDSRSLAFISYQTLR